MQKEASRIINHTIQSAKSVITAITATLGSNSKLKRQDHPYYIRKRERAKK